MWPNPQFPADLVTITEEILKGKLHFLCSVMVMIWWVSARLLKTCDSFPKPPEIIFKSYTEKGQFSNDLKRGNVVTIDEKMW